MRPILREIGRPFAGTFMNAFSPVSPAGAWVSFSRRHDAAGRLLLQPIADHRILVHASAETWSACLASGARHLRRAGDIDLLPADETGGFASETACETLEIRLAPSLLERVSDDMRRGNRVHFQTRHILRNESIAHLARALDSEQRAGGSVGALYADSIGAALATQLLGSSAETVPPRNGLSPAQLRRLFDFIDAHIDQPLPIAALSREAGASSAHLRHWFKLATGKTVHRYVVGRRLERARRLLLAGELSVAEVALAAGFSHQSHMARWMRREMGYTPRGLLRTLRT
jgi:AraC family transcriptional regulator